MTPELSTERFALYLPRIEDFPAYQTFYADAEASAFYGGPLRTDQAWRVLAGHAGHWQLRGYGLWAVRDKTTGQTLGGCGFTWAEGWPRRELTWWLLPEARGRGVATETSVAAINHAYTEYGWDLVETHMDDKNLAAKALVERLGGTPIAREPFPDGRARTVYELPRPK